MNLLFTDRNVALALTCSSIFCASFALMAVGCSKPKAAPSAADASVEQPVSSTVIASSSPPPAPSGPTLPNVGIANRMANEASHRPTGTPKAEDVYAALSNAGMKIVEKSQHMAAPFGAQYCLGAEVEGQLAMSVCEYGSEQGAKDGREMSLKAFKVVANRDISINKATTFTVREKTKSPEVDATAKRAQQLFAAL